MILCYLPSSTSITITVNHPPSYSPLSSDICTKTTIQVSLLHIREIDTTRVKPIEQKSVFSFSPETRYTLLKFANHPQSKCLPHITVLHNLNILLALVHLPIAHCHKCQNSMTMSSIATSTTSWTSSRPISYGMTFFWTGVLARFKHKLWMITQLGPGMTKRLLINQSEHCLDSAHFPLAVRKESWTVTRSATRSIFVLGAAAWILPLNITRRIGLHQSSHPA